MEYVGCNIEIFEMSKLSKLYNNSWLVIIGEYLYYYSTWYYSIIICAQYLWFVGFLICLICLISVDGKFVKKKKKKNILDVKLDVNLLSQVFSNL